jgi:hypothetical protein
MADAMMMRDLHGYGQRRPLAAWPGAARIAVSFVLNYEEGGERNVLDGDAHAKIIWYQRSQGCHQSPGAVASSRTSSNTVAAPVSGACCDCLRSEGYASPPGQSGLR